LFNCLAGTLNSITVINGLPLLFQYFISQSTGVHLTSMHLTGMHLRPERHMLISSLLPTLLLVLLALLFVLLVPLVPLVVLPLVLGIVPPAFSMAAGFLSLATSRF